MYLYIRRPGAVDSYTRLDTHSSRWELAAAVRRGRALESTTMKLEVRRASTLPTPASSMPVTVSSSPITAISAPCVSIPFFCAAQRRVAVSPWRLVSGVCVWVWQLPGELWVSSVPCDTRDGARARQDLLYRALLLRPSAPAVRQVRSGSDAAPPLPRCHRGQQRTAGAIAMSNCRRGACP